MGLKLSLCIEGNLIYLCHIFISTYLFSHFTYSNFYIPNLTITCFQSYNAKLSDFGLAKDGPADGQSHVSTRVMGTHGYAAPEYMATSNII